MRRASALQMFILFVFFGSATVSAYPGSIIHGTIGSPNDGPTRKLPAVSTSTGSGVRATRISGPALHAIEGQLLAATNNERARYGLPALALDPHLLKGARRHAAWMTNSRQLQHTSAAVGENIAMGQSSVNEVMQSWMNSPGHRANILNGSYSRLGVAAYRTSGGTIYWCQQFRW